MIFGKSVSISDFASEIKKSKKYYIFIQLSPKKKKSPKRFYAKNPWNRRSISVFFYEFISGELKIEDKKCKTPTLQKRGKKSKENIDKGKEIFSLDIIPLTSWKRKINNQ